MKFFGLFLLTFLFALTVQAQTLMRELPLKVNGLVEITNWYGRVAVSAEETQDGKVSITAQPNNKSFTDSEMKAVADNGKVTVQINPKDERIRVDLTIKIPLRARVKVETRAGEVRVAGNVESAEVLTETGTISTDVPLENLKYNFLWRGSRPRYVSDIPLEEYKERSGGRFTMSGKLGEAAGKGQSKKTKSKGEDDPDSTEPTPENTTDPEKSANGTDKDPTDKDDKNKGKKPKDNGQISLNFTTDRGIVLLNVDPSQVPSDLRERPLTEAAKAIVRSGDSLLMEAIRRASPKYFGDYAKTLPPRRREPVINNAPKPETASKATVKKAVVRVSDINNRAIGGLKKEDFVVTEGGKEREILKVEPSTASFNLVLMLDVSGSVENYVNFIRKAARNFLNTTGPQDKVSIIVFNEDVKQITTFTTDKTKLSESLDTFDAGGGTAYYDALAYSLVDSLRPFRGERTAVVILSDGDDNRSFLPFDALLGSIQESGALIYPLYVPSALIAASATRDPNQSLDPLRTRYMALTSKAEAEGAQLAKISGGVYYPIRQLGDLQKAYDDIVVQLRTSYLITFRSDAAETGSPRLKVRTNREGTFVNIGTVYDSQESQGSLGSLESPGSLGSPWNQEISGNLENAENFESQNFRLTPDSQNSPDSQNFQNFRDFRDFQYFQDFPDSQQIQEITGDVSAIVTYKPLLTQSLPVIAAEGFDVNKSPPAFILNGPARLALSRWVSPKRTRSYPYERIYDTLTQSKRVTIIPILKDEGQGGERDFLQFDTVSLMSLLNVYVVLGFYADAERDASNELTDQKFDKAYISEELNELNNFKGSAAEWNLKQLQEVSAIAEKAAAAYREIAKKTGVTLHDERGIAAFVNRITKGLEDFRAFSRQKSQKAQNREFQTVQPKEALSSDTKARVTISDRAGGVYFFTCDETKVDNETLFLIEDKHTSRAKLPAASNIKDGLLKMMLYANLKNGRIGQKDVGIKAVLRLTSNRLEGKISSGNDIKSLEAFLNTNKFTKNQKAFVTRLMEEARTNNFEIRIEEAHRGE